MSILIISFLVCFIIISFKFIYEKILVQIEELQDFNKDVIKSFKNLEAKVSEYQKKQEDLKESFSVVSYKKPKNRVFLSLKRLYLSPIKK